MTQSNDMPDEIYVILISGNAKGGHKKKTLSAVRADSPLIFERTGYIRADLTPPQSPNRAVELKQVRDALVKCDHEINCNKIDMQEGGGYYFDESAECSCEHKKYIATLSRLSSAPVGVKKIDGLEEAIEWDTPDDEVTRISNSLSLDKDFVKRTQDEYRTVIVISGDYFNMSYYSDYMEPEDATFNRDLSWVKNELERAYAKGFQDAMEKCSK